MHVERVCCLLVLNSVTSTPDYMSTCKNLQHAKNLQHVKKIGTRKKFSTKKLEHAKILNKNVNMHVGVSKMHVMIVTMCSDAFFF